MLPCPFLKSIRRRSASQSPAGFCAGTPFDSFEWVSKWAGTRGGGRALRVSWPAKGAAQPSTFLELLDKRVIGDWEDLHAIDRDGLLFCTVTHERMVFTRVSTNSPELLDRGEVAEPEFIERLQKAL